MLLAVHVFIDPCHNTSAFGCPSLLLFPPIEKPAEEKVRKIEVFFAPKSKCVEQIPKTNTLGISTNNLFNIFVDKSPGSKVAESLEEPPAKKQKVEMPKKAETTFSPSFFTQKAKEKPKKVAAKKALAQIKGQSKITAFMRV